MKRVKGRLTMGLGGLLLVVSAAAAAESSYNCPRGIVALGDTTYEVAQRCGTPTGIETVSGAGADDIVENWYFDRAGRIPYVFRMRGGRLNAIDRHARARDPRIQQVMASVVCQHKRMLVAGSDGTRVFVVTA